MKKKLCIYISIILCISLLLSGCSRIKVDTKEKVSTPLNNEVPIEGIWNIVSYKTKEDEDNKELDKNINTKVQFSKEFVKFGEDICYNPSFKIKTVDAEQYLIYAYKKNKQEFDITNDKINIISITSKDGHFYDVIEIDDKNAIINIYNTLFYIKKEQNKVPKNETLKNKNQIKREDGKKENNNETLRTTLLLGLVSENSIKDINYSEQNKNVRINNYRTISINVNNKEVNRIMETGKILVPRLTGFWSLSTEMYFMNGKMVETLSPFIIEDKRKSFIKLEFKNILLSRYSKNENLLCRIRFITDNYVGIEYGKGEDIEKTKYNHYAVFPLDNLNYDSLKISDVIKMDNKTYFEQIKDEYKKKGMIATEKNFSMERKNGHWMMVGRAISKDNPLKYEDYMLNLVPSRGLLNYDDLSVSWNDIKSKVPDAKDAYTSPNKDIAIIVNSENLFIYSLKDNIISKKPIGSIKLENGEKVIMAEWARGEYAEKWYKVSEYISSRNIELIKNK